MVPHINVIEFLQWVKKTFTFSTEAKGWVKTNEEDSSVYSEKLVYKEYMKQLDNQNN